MAGTRSVLRLSSGGRRWRTGRAGRGFPVSPRGAERVRPPGGRGCCAKSRAAGGCLRPCVCVSVYVCERVCSQWDAWVRVSTCVHRVCHLCEQMHGCVFERTLWSLSHRSLWTLLRCPSPAGRGSGRSLDLGPEAAGLSLRTCTGQLETVSHARCPAPPPPPRRLCPGSRWAPEEAETSREQKAESERTVRGRQCRAG